jgi:hypothetical protein
MTTILAWTVFGLTSGLLAVVFAARYCQQTVRARTDCLETYMSAATLLSDYGETYGRLE